MLQILEGHHHVEIYKAAKGALFQLNQKDEDEKTTIESTGK